MSGPVETGERAGTPPLGSILGPVPLWVVAVAVGALGGEGCSARLPPERLGTAAGIALAACVALLVGVTLRAVTARQTPVGPLGVGAGLCGALLLILAGAGGVLLRDAVTARGLLPALADRGGQAELVATVAVEPRPTAAGWQVVVTAREIDGTPIRARAAFTVSRDPPVLGSTWSGSVTARPLPDGGYGGWLARQHVAVVLDPVTWEMVRGPGRLSAASEVVRERTRQAATRHLDDAVGGLLVGFVTGDVRLLPERDQDAMLATGLTHLTAVSGSNVAIVLAGVLAVATLAHLGARTRWVLVATVVPWFAFVTRFEPSVLRAGTMAGLVLLAGVRGHPRDARHALGAAVLVLLLVDPRLAGSVGLVLSASATAGVLVLAPLLRARLPERMPPHLADVAAITLGAQLAVAPVLLVTFGELPLAALPANLVAIPAASLAATIAFVGTVLALVHVELGAPVFALAGLPARIVLEVAHGFAGVAGVVEVARPATVTALASACLWLLLRRGRRGRPLVAAVLGAALVAVALPVVTVRLPADGLSITAIDVGQGDAFLIEGPGARILVDAGEDGRAARWLRQRGRPRLDLAVVTHPHLDHYGGMPEVLRSVRVGVLWAAPPDEGSELEETLAAAAERGVPVRRPEVGEVVTVGDLVVEVLHPPPGRPYRYARSEANEASYVLRIHHGPARILLTGDIEREAQRGLLAGSADRLAADVLTVPHHGAATSDAAFLAAVGARVGLIGVGADNRHGHPHPDALAVLDELGVEVRRTDLEGSFTVVLTGRDPRSLAGLLRRAGPATSHRVSPRGAGSLLPHGPRAAAHR